MIAMRTLPSGHVTVDSMHLHPDGFSVPEQAPDMCIKDFTYVQSVGAMLAQRGENTRNREAHCVCDANTFEVRHCPN